MYAIGAFSKKTGVTIRTLRYYDEKNLLKPSYVSESGRRYYKDEDIITLQKIMTLKFLGYSLEDVEVFIDENDWNLHDSLVYQKEQLERKKEQIEQSIRTLDMRSSYLRMGKRSSRISLSRSFRICAWSMSRRAGCVTFFRRTLSRSCMMSVRMKWRNPIGSS